MRIRHISVMCLAAAVLVVTGCDNGPKVVKVSGTATYKGVPVPYLTLIFQPEKGRPSNGRTDDQGHFTLSYDPQVMGAVVGKHTVSAVYQDSPDTMGKPMPPTIKAITSKYGDTVNSPMKIEITGPTDDLKLEFN